MSLEALPAVLDTFHAPNGAGIVAVQEIPRSSPGWHVEEKGPLTILSYQDDASRRGVGVAYRAKEWTVMRRKAKGRATWFRIRRLADGLELWLGSAHFSQGVSCAVHQNEVSNLLQLLPATTLPCVIGADGNSPLGWTRDDEEGTIVVGKEAKSNLMIGAVEKAGFRFCGPAESQFETPTSRPRKEGAHGNCIDWMACKHVGHGCLRVHVGSYATMDTDHEYVSVEVRVERRPPTERHRRRIDTRPRRVSGKINQEILKGLAKHYTKPEQTQGYRDPPDVRALYDMARAGGDKCAWKKAHQARRRARYEWNRQNLARAAQGDWREAKRQKTNVGKQWELEYANYQMEKGVEPHRSIHEHFAGIFANGPVDLNQFEGEFDRSPDFSKTELLQAVGKAKLGKSVGVDGTSAELFRELVLEEATVDAILAWYNDILHSGVMPEEWGHSLMQQPLEPTELRPIALGSAAAKVYSRMLLARASAHFQPHTAVQCAAAVRQSADFLFTIACTFQLEREWKGGAIWVKIDISKAFDSLRRDKFLARLLKVLGRTEEARSWIRSFQGTASSILTMWGETSIPLRTGIKQGAIESPSFFSKVVEWVFQGAAEAAGWPEDSGCFPEMPCPWRIWTIVSFGSAGPRNYRLS